MSRRLTTVRRTNFAIAMACPLLLLALLWLCYQLYILPAWMFYLSLPFALAVLGYFIHKTWRWAAAARKDEAAKAIDRAVGGKDRFLTLATTTSINDEAKDILSQQGAELSKSYDPQSAIEFKLERPARHSVYASPVLLLLILAIFLFTPESSKAKQRIAKLSSEQADEIRDFVDDHANMPEQVKDDLLELADTVEDDGLLSETVIEQLQDVLNELDDVDFTPENNQETASLDQPQADIEDAPEDKPQDDQQSQQEKQAQQEQQTASNDDPQKEQEQKDQQESEQQAQQQSAEGQQEKPAESGKKGQGEQQEK
ncbi:MAG: hypothetical protein KDD66_10845, partial [Bdellovibrionales bacterium]|nr:hypothetical protein [Bdellovibrionales bacterium]